MGQQELAESGSKGSLCFGANAEIFANSYSFEILTIFSLLGELFPCFKTASYFYCLKVVNKMQHSAFKLKNSFA